MDGGSARRGVIYHKRLFLLVGVLFAVSLPCATRANPRPECVVVDTDVDFDDIRAIAVLAGSKQVVAIVTTEGIARPEEGAAAVEHFLGRIGANIPVIRGESPNSHRGYVASPDLPKWRKAAEHLNGTFGPFPNPELSAHPPPSSITDRLWPLLSGCQRVELLVIGPWTSFMRYGPEILDRVDLIVAQGRPDPDELEGQPAGFNCVYDLNSCLAAYDLLVGRRQRKDRHLRANWVDIPQSPDAVGSAEAGVDGAGRRVYPFAPTLEWATELQKAGKGAAVISEILLKDPNGWKNTSLWDDLAALYLLRPEIFASRGGHWEPQIKAAAIRQILTEYIAK